MLFKMETPKQFEQVCQDLEKAAVNNQFGVMAIHNLNETMKKKAWNSIAPAGSSRSAIPIRLKRSWKGTWTSLRFSPAGFRFLWRETK